MIPLGKQIQTSLRLISVSLSNVLYCDVSVVSRCTLYLNKTLFTLSSFARSIRNGNGFNGPKWQEMHNIYLLYYKTIVTSVSVDMKYYQTVNLNLSCTKDFRNLISMVTWCIN